MRRTYPSVEAMARDNPRLLRFWLADLEATVDEVMAVGQPIPLSTELLDVFRSNFRSKEEKVRIKAEQDWYPQWAAEVHATL